jgi:molybdopterin-guanine dinucleotide biosynthesis protein A
MTTEPIAGLILAGGQSRRLGGGDKALLSISGRTLLDRVIERVAPQAAPLLLNVNGDPRRFAGFGLPVVADCIAGQVGPLAGILAGLEWLRNNRPEILWMASFPTDAPLLPRDLVDRLRFAVDRQAADLGCALSGGRSHPVIGLWPVRLSGALRHALVVEGARAVHAWSAGYVVAHAEWPSADADPFFNVNTPDDIITLNRLLDDAPPGL